MVRKAYAMDTQQRRSVAAKVVERRKNLGWSQARLAEEAGVSENTVLSIEKGKHGTQPGKLAAVLAALDLTTGNALSLEGASEDVQNFLRVALSRLSALPEDRRARLLADLYPRLLMDSDNNHTRGV
jgi:transcriptional regulator with XRE-family HTH domain